ncbi:MAG TPA: anti-sigma factor [Caldimonas sp.]|nr:anti-sigma factor [Caldimonas sp.]
MTPTSPITEADLLAWVDGELSAERAGEIEAYLATRPHEAERLEAYRAQKRELHALFDPVLDEQLPERLVAAARPPAYGRMRAVAAGLAIALLGGVAGWVLRGSADPSGQRAPATSSPIAAIDAGDFAQRAAVAHAVYSPDARRPVEVGAAQEDQLVAWLSKRMGTPMKPPHLQALGYALEGGRLLPGGRGPVAQFMYRDDAGGKLTLYVSNDVAAPGTVAPSSQGTAATAQAPGAEFRFAQEGGGVNVFYWVEGRFGYALSSSAGRDELARVATVVYRELKSGR